MDKKDFKNVCKAAGGIAMCAASGAVMHAAPYMPSMEVVGDMAKVAAVVAAALGVSGTLIATIGLAPLAYKYGEKFYNYVKQKIQQKYHISENEADKMLQNSVSNENNSSSKSNIKEDLKDGYNRGAPINQPVLRSATKENGNFSANSQAVLTRKSTSRNGM